MRSVHRMTPEVDQERRLALKDAAVAKRRFLRKVRPKRKFTQKGGGVFERKPRFNTKSRPPKQAATGCFKVHNGQRAFKRYMFCFQIVWNATFQTGLLIVLGTELASWR